MPYYVRYGLMTVFKAQKMCQVTHLILAHEIYALCMIQGSVLFFLPITFEVDATLCQVWFDDIA